MRVDFCCDRFGTAYEDGDIGWADGMWCVGCDCAGGYDVLEDIKHCPFCGTALLNDAYCCDEESDE